MLQPDIKRLKTCLLERKEAIVIKSTEEIPTLINFLASMNVTQSRALENIDTKMLHDWFYFHENQKDGSRLCVRVFGGNTAPHLLVHGDSLQYSRIGVTVHAIDYFRKEGVRVNIYRKKVINNV